MVRLKSYLWAMGKETKDWKEMYEGRAMVPACTPGNPDEFPEFINDTTRSEEHTSELQSRT